MAMQRLKEAAEKAKIELSGVTQPNLISLYYHVGRWTAAFGYEYYQGKI